MRPAQPRRAHEAQAPGAVLRGCVPQGDPLGSNEGGGHLTPGMDPYREVSRTGPVGGAGSLPVPLGYTPVGPAGLGWPP